jgi:hypothetical protein
MAAGGARIQVTGAKELRAALRKMGNDLEGLKNIHLNAAAVVMREALSLVPVMTGNLKNTIRPGATDSRAFVTAGNNVARRTRNSTLDFGGVPYAGVIHFGWPKHNIEPQPFLYDAIDKRRNEVVGLYEVRVAELVERVGRETP